MELFYLIADFFNSMSPILRVVTIVGIALIFVGVILVCCLVAYAKKKRKVKFEQERHEWQKRALEKFMSTQKDSEKELSERYNKENKTDGITAEPVLEEKTEDRTKSETLVAEAVGAENEVGESEDSDIPSESISISETDYESVDAISVTEVDATAFSDELSDERGEADVTDGSFFEVDAERNDGDIFAFVKDKEKKQPAGFAIKLADADDGVKANYCDIVNYVLSYKKIKMKKSANSEKAYFGTNLLFMLKIHGKSLRVYYALRFADYEYTTIPVSYEGDKKSYEKTPVMLKITGPLSVKRAKILIDDVAKRLGCQKVK